MRRLKVAIIDPDEEFRGNLSFYMLKSYLCFDLVGSCANAEEFMAAGWVDQIDVLFTGFDFKMEGHGADGAFVQSYVRMNNSHCLIVFLSEDQGDAYRAFSYGAFGFLSKPLHVDPCIDLLNRIRSHYEELGFFREREGSSFIAKTRAGYDIIRTDSTLYIELVSRRCVFHMEGGREIALSGYSMKKMEERFGEYGFFRCHQSMLVNLAKINAVIADNDSKYYSLTLEGCNTEIPLSREKYNELLAELQERYANLPR